MEHRYRCNITPWTWNLLCLQSRDYPSPPVIITASNAAVIGTYVFQHFIINYRNYVFQLPYLEEMTGGYYTRLCFGCYHSKQAVSKRLKCLNSSAKPGNHTTQHGTYYYHLFPELTIFSSCCN